MSGLRAHASLAAFLGLVALVAIDAPGSTAARLIRPAPGAPDPKQMVLGPAELGGAKVTKQGYYKDRDFPSAISYSREFGQGVSRRAVLLYVDSEAEVGTSAASTSTYLAALRRVFGTKQGRAVIAQSFEKSIRVEGAPTHVQVGRPQTVGISPGAFDVAVSLRLLGLRTVVHVTAFAVERVLGSLVTVGAPGHRVSLSTVTSLANTSATRMGVELAPRNIGPPTISGTAQAAETLTASPGTWAGAPATFTDQWQRCDGSGANCADIPTATGETYFVTNADVGATIRVAVTARNDVGSATASSASTPVVFPVPASGAPRIVVRPSILGTAHVGQTLTASTGTWTGNPTRFGFQWVRCPVNLVGCGETIQGAMQGSYVVSESDVGSRIWVDVTATNEFGSTRTSSAPTAVVAP